MQTIQTALGHRGIGALMILGIALFFGGLIGIIAMGR
jgi:hypothetical protein